MTGSSLCAISKECAALLASGLLWLLVCSAPPSQPALN